MMNSLQRRDPTAQVDNHLSSPIPMSPLNNQLTGAVAEALSKLIWADARLLLPSFGVCKPSL
jgi:hypothetical protein